MLVDVEPKINGEPVGRFNSKGFFDDDCKHEEEKTIQKNLSVTSPFAFSSCLALTTRILRLSEQRAGGDPLDVERGRQGGARRSATEVAIGRQQN